MKHSDAGCTPPHRQDSSRVDTSGRAYARSQRQIQTYINEYPERLDQALINHPQFPYRDASIEWVSPLRSSGYEEYRDGDFLHHLGLSYLAPSLSNFWPRRGPCWDALAHFRVNDQPGCILIEAKSHVPEIYGNGCGASGRSRALIENSLQQTKHWLGADALADWTGPLYQSANRYAHLYFLRQLHGIHAFLVNVYFLNDPRSPTTLENWTSAIREVHSVLGLNASVPFTASLFLNALA